MAPPTTSQPPVGHDYRGLGVVERFLDAGGTFAEWSGVLDGDPWEEAGLVQNTGASMESVPLPKETVPKRRGRPPTMSDVGRKMQPNLQSELMQGNQ